MPAWAARTGPAAMAFWRTDERAQAGHRRGTLPRCPVEVAKGWYQMIHRYFAGALGLVILVIAVQAVRRRAEPAQPLKLPLAILALVILQGAFGMWTVTLQLWPQVVTAHLLGGFATLSLLTLLTLRLSGRFAPLQLPGAPAHIGGSLSAIGYRADRPRRLGQLQLRGRSPASTCPPVTASGGRRWISARAFT